MHGQLDKPKRRTRRKFDDDFKRKIIAELESGVRKRFEIVRDERIAHSVLTKWQKEFKGAGKSYRAAEPEPQVLVAKSRTQRRRIFRVIYEVEEHEVGPLIADLHDRAGVSAPTFHIEELVDRRSLRYQPQAQLPAPQTAPKTPAQSTAKRRTPRTSEQMEKDKESILRLLENGGALSRQTIADKLSLDADQVSANLQRLRNLGNVERIGRGSKFCTWRIKK